jgi:anti-anti-sigma factor
MSDHPRIRSQTTDLALCHRPTDTDTPVPPWLGRPMSGARQFRAHTSVREERTTITVSGELDLATSPRLRQAAEEALARCPRCVEIDLGLVTFCDCSGLNVLLGARASAHLEAIPFTVVKAHAPVTRLFHLAEAGPLFGEGEEDNVIASDFR